MSDGTPRWRQVAADLHQQIDDGRLHPGRLLPPQSDLAKLYGVGVDAIRDAFALLRSYGLIDVGQGYRARVRQWPEREVIEVGAGVRVFPRPPTDAERRALNLDDGVCVIQVGDDVYPGDRYEVVFRAEPTAE